MENAKRPIFRTRAMQSYAQSMEKDVLPRTATPRVFIFLWILLGLLISAAITAWFGEIPVIVAGSGIIQAEQGGNTAVAVVFLPASYLSRLQVGQPVQLQIASTGQQFKYVIDNIVPGSISPTQARQQYNLGDAGSLIAPGPSVVVMVTLGHAIPVGTFEGSIVTAQVQVGSQRILSLFPDLTHSLEIGQ